MSSLIVTPIQSALHWEKKEDNLRMFEEKILQFKEQTHVMVLPEMFSTGFSMNPSKLAETMDGPTVQWMRDISAKRKAILAGSVIIEENDRYYNRFIWMLPNGLMGHYDKRHLFAYAEEDKYYSAGTQRLVTSVNGWKILCVVCYDLRFPVWMRQQSNDLPEYDAIIIVANWPQRRANAWNALLKARAIENQCYVVAVNRIGEDGKGIQHSGDSSVIDPLGEILFHNSGEEAIQAVALDKTHLTEIRNKFPFWKDGDQFEVFT